MFGARVIGVLWGAEQLDVVSQVKGFLQVRLANGVIGFVPLAVGSEQALQEANGVPPSTRVVQPVGLYRAPEPGQQIIQIVATDERLQVLSQGERFVEVVRADGQRGYVPKLITSTPIAMRGEGATAYVTQPVWLYDKPEAGGQRTSQWLVFPDEQLLKLGGDTQFLLVQRESGQLGYVPAAVCGGTLPLPGSIIRVGPIDLGWIVIGGFWTLANIVSLTWSIRSFGLVGAGVRPYLVLGIVLGCAGALWLLSGRKYLARSFAIGILLAYAFVHVVSSGYITLWR